MASRLQPWLGSIQYSPVGQREGVRKGTGQWEDGGEERVGGTEGAGTGELGDMRVTGWWVEAKSGRERGRMKMEERSSWGVEEGWR